MSLRGLDTGGSLQGQAKRTSTETRAVTAAASDGRSESIHCMRLQQRARRPDHSFQKGPRTVSSITAVFTPDHERYHGVRPINIYLLRLLFVLVILFVGSDSWLGLFRHQGGWDPVRAAAVCMWAAFSALAILALIDPLRWLPIVAFEIFYKVVWLVVVAYPLWSRNQLAGSPAAEMTFVFSWVLLPIVAMPWGYFFKTYVARTNTRRLARDI